MKKLLLVLGCYGLVVSSVAADERWSAETCRHLQEMKVEIKAQDVDEQFKSIQLFAVLLRQAKHCDPSVVGEIERTVKILKAADEANLKALKDASSPALQRQPQRQSQPQPRQPMFCDTTPKAYGGSTTDCF
jgi:hypothetical protein